MIYFYYRAKKLNTAVKWIGFVGGLIGLFTAGILVHKEKSKKATISTVSTVAQDVRHVPNKSLDNIKYLNDVVSELTKESREK